MKSALLVICALVPGAPAQAETFRVTLGGTVLGQLSYAADGGDSSLRSTLDNTPMGVFNGSFTGTSAGTAATSSFTGDSRSSRKQRVVHVEIAKGRALRTDVAPPDELTALSDPARVPADVMDPVQVLGALIRADGCPAAMRLYDGRRVVALTPAPQQLSDDTLLCTLSYKVIAGPGHLSPLRISSATMALRYGTEGGQQNLQHIKISSGIFGLSLDRVD
jgi:hypothetical protein